MTDPVAHAPETAAPPTPKDRRCRSLRVNGLQCNSTALLGQQFCQTHLHYRHPEFPRGRIVVPLLEDHSAIQLVLSQVAHGIFTCGIDIPAARALTYVCQVAAATLPRPVGPRLKPTDEKPPFQKPVSEVTLAPDGEPLGPDEPWIDPAAPKPVWSFDKYLLDHYCQHLNKPRVTTPEDLPPAGWLTEDEMKEKAADFEAFFDDFEQRAMDARRQADILDRLTPEERDACPRGQCSSQKKIDHPCKWCRLEIKERAERAAAPPNPEVPPPSALDLQASTETRSPQRNRRPRRTAPPRRAPRLTPRPSQPSPSLPRPLPGACPPAPVSGSRGVIELDNSSNLNISNDRHFPAEGRGHAPQG